MEWSSSSNVEPALPSPTLTNPDMILPHNGDDSHAAADALPSLITPTPHTLRHLPPLRMVRSLQEPQNSRPPSATEYPVGRSWVPGMLPPAPTSDYLTAESAAASTMELLAPGTKRQSRGFAVTDQLKQNNLTLLGAPSWTSNRDSMHSLGRESSLSVPNANSGSEGRSSTVFEGEDMVGSVYGSAVRGGYSDGAVMDDERCFYDENLYDAPDDLDDPSMDDGGDEQSSAALGRRAEWILAAAKEKLSALEGNLSRARYSLGRAQSLHSTPSPAGSRHSAVGGCSQSTSDGATTDPRAASARPVHESNSHRRRTSSSSKSSAGHARAARDGAKDRSPSNGLHEANVKALEDYYQAGSQAQQRDPATPAQQPNGRMPAGDPWSKPLSSPVGQRNYLGSFSSSNWPGFASYQVPLGPVDEERFGDAVAPGANGLSRSESAAAPNSRSWAPEAEAKALARSRSAVPIREVRDQMEDLKGRISSLQRRAKEDHLKRRSQQSLRAPSPSGSAEQWYRSTDTYNEDGWSTSAGVGRSERSNSLAESVVSGADVGLATAPSSDAGHVADPQEESPGSRFPSVGEGISASDATVEGFDTTGDGASSAERQQDTAALDADDAATQGSPEWHAANDELEEPDYPTVTGERHEDRADAFDYEHFFLHSGMGNYSAGEFMRRDSYASVNSVDSTETARPGDDSPRPTRSRVEAETNAQAEQAAMQARLLERNVSADSVATMASFATAREGRDGDDSTEGDDDDNDDDDDDEYGVDENGLWEMAQQPSFLAPSRIGPALAPHREGGDSSARSDGSHTPTQDNPGTALEQATQGPSSRGHRPQQSSDATSIVRRHTLGSRARRGWASFDHNVMRPVFAFTSTSAVEPLPPSSSPSLASTTASAASSSSHHSHARNKSIDLSSYTPFPPSSAPPLASTSSSSLPSSSTSPPSSAFPSFPSIHTLSGPAVRHRRASEQLLTAAIDINNTNNSNRHHHPNPDHPSNRNHPTATTATTTHKNIFVIPPGLAPEDYALFDSVLQSLRKASLQLQGPVQMHAGARGSTVAPAIGATPVVGSGGEAGDRSTGGRSDVSTSESANDKLVEVRKHLVAAKELLEGR